MAPYTLELVGALRSGPDGHDIDLFVDEPLVPRTAAGNGAAPGSAVAVRSAHDFIWKHRQQPYDLTVYQLGNSSAHDFLWPYLFRYPGLAVLHDAQLHHARAAALLRQRRIGDYRDEFAANHPDVSVDAAELAIAGFDTHLYYSWPMTRLVVQASRVTAVHARLEAEALRDETPGAVVEAIRLGHGERLSPERAEAASARVRGGLGIPSGAVLFGVFGGLTPEKRLPQVLEAFAALLPYAPEARLLLAGAPAPHYDLAADIDRLGIAASVAIAGYVEDGEAFTDHIAACDVAVNLRWPTAREISGPWLRALAAGRATITTDLAHTADVPALDPRTWTLTHASQSPAVNPDPVTVKIDVLDEDHSLRLAMRRLAADPALRRTLGRAAVKYWEREHSLPRMVDDYRRVLALAIATPSPAPALPPHLRATGAERLDELLGPFGFTADVWGRI